MVKVVTSPQKQWAPIVPADQVDAKRRAVQFDRLPPALRAAIRDCPFYISIGLNPRGLDVEGILERIKALKSVDEAREFTKLMRG